MSDYIIIGLLLFNTVVLWDVKRTQYYDVYGIGKDNE